jgi:hypothetical protein
MYILLWAAAAWLSAALIVTAVFFGAKRSRMLYHWLFGDRPGAEVHRLVTPVSRADATTRLAA